VAAEPPSGPGEGRPGGPEPGAPGPFPEPLLVRQSVRSLWLFWLIPVIALAVGGWLGVRALLDRGPTITIEFRTADGLEAGKTRIKYKDVDIGVVKTIGLTDDHSRVRVSAELAKGLDSVLAEDTRFWVVRPRVGTTGVTGLGTLFSGAYVGVDIGKSAEHRSEFTGLESPPQVTTDVPGRQFVLQADDLGSLEVGTPVYFRHVAVGQVVSYEIEPAGRNVTVQLFVNAPYDRFVTRDTRFWQASGVDVSFDTNGLKVDTQSLASILIGGVAFETPQEPGAQAAPPADANTRFRLAADRADAYKRTDVGGTPYVMLFKGSVRGLNVGAPVDFRGIVLGEVTDIRVNFVSPDRDVDMAVFVRVYPQRLREVYVNPLRESSAERERQVLDAMVQHGFRAQLRSGNLLTGQLYVALDFFPRSPRSTVDWARNPPEFPTVPGTLDTLQQSLESIAGKLEKIPLDTLAEQASKTFGHLDQAIQHADGAIGRLENTLQGADAVLGQVSTRIAPEAQAMLQDARRALDTLNRTVASVGGDLGAASPLQSDARRTLAEVAAAARALRVLSDYLERHPESLLRGKPEDEK